MPTVLIAGGTGLIGTRLSQLLSEKGYTVLHLSRKRDLNSQFPAYQWDIEKGILDLEALKKADYIINLAGAGVAEGSWTQKRKQAIIKSRTDGALLFKRSLEQLDTLPKAYISASGIGYYGNRGDALLKEEDQAGSEGFLPESVIAWENAIQEVATIGIRTVAFRTGLVLSTKGGALEQLLMPLNFFVAAYFGNGNQWYSWIHIDDQCRLYIRAIEDESFSGIYNAVAPHPVRNKEFTQQIIQASGKPVLLMPAPRFALRLALGEMADAILVSTNVSSAKIEATGFQFEFPHLLPALKDVIARKI